METIPCFHPCNAKETRQCAGQAMRDYVQPIQFMLLSIVGGEICYYTVDSTLVTGLYVVVHDLWWP